MNVNEPEPKWDRCTSVWERGQQTEHGPTVEPFAGLQVQALFQCCFKVAPKDSKQSWGGVS